MLRETVLRITEQDKNELIHFIHQLTKMSRLPIPKRLELANIAVARMLENRPVVIQEVNALLEEVAHYCSGSWQAKILDVIPSAKDAHCRRLLFIAKHIMRQCQAARMIQVQKTVSD